MPFSSSRAQDRDVGARHLASVAIFVAGCASASGNPQDLAAPVIVYDLSNPYDFSIPIADLSGDLAGDMGNGICPSGTIPPSVNTLYAGDTTAGPNLASDTRTGWTTEPDHALLFVAPKAGSYLVSMTSTNQVGNDCGAILRAYGTANNGAFYTESSCPTPGMVAAIDGAYAATPGGTTTTISLSNAQHVLMWVSCSGLKTITYDLKVQFQ